MSKQIKQRKSKQQQQQQNPQMFYRSKQEVGGKCSDNNC